MGRAGGAGAAGRGSFHDGLDRPAATRRQAMTSAASPSTMKLLIATRNQGKIREMRDLFAGLPFDLAFPPDRFLERLPDEPDLERGTSFAENAVAKARYFAKRA
ncbi:MAG: hypothetical protein DMD67_01620, partial [Gemmatimonadetes bacterium]